VFDRCSIFLAPRTPFHYWERPRYWAKVCQKQVVLGEQRLTSTPYPTSPLSLFIVGMDGASVFTTVSATAFALFLELWALAIPFFRGITEIAFGFAFFVEAGLFFFSFAGTAPEVSGSPES